MLEQLTEHVWRFPRDPATDRPNIGYVAGERAALLFEAGNSAAHAVLIRNAIAAAGLAQPRFLCVSHWHWDHSFGLEAWESWGVHTIAGARTNAKLREVAAWAWDDASMRARLASRDDIEFCDIMIRREYPDRSKIKVVPAELEFVGSLELDLGGVTCRLFHIGGPHSDDAVGCLVPEDGLLFLGDSDCQDLYSEPWHYDPDHPELMDVELGRIGYEPAKLEPYLRLVEGVDFDVCLNGHGEPRTKAEFLAAF